MEKKNIWGNLNFTKGKQKSAFDLLREQSGFLINATKGELQMEVTAADGYISANPPRIAAIYTLYVVAPKLGNYRRKILTVAEYATENRFPVDIVVNIDNNDKISNVDGDEFIEKVEEILSRPLIKASIQNLFVQSKEVDNRIMLQYVFTKPDDVFEFKGPGGFEGDFLSTNISFDRAKRVNNLFYFINEVQYPVIRKLSNVNPYATEFEVYEDRPFKLHFEGFEANERIVMNYRIVDIPLFFQ